MLSTPSSFNLLEILFPPPCTMTGMKPNLFNMAISSMNILNNLSSTKTLPPHLMTMYSSLYFSKYCLTSEIEGPLSGSIWIKSSSLMGNIK